MTDKEKLAKIKQYIDFSILTNLCSKEYPLSTAQYIDFVTDTTRVNCLLENKEYGNAESIIMRLLHKYKNDFRCMVILQHILSEKNV